METDLYEDCLDETLSSFTDQLPAGQSTELQKLAGEGSPSTENTPVLQDSSIANSLPCPLQQPSVEGGEITDGDETLPEKTRIHPGNSSVSWSLEEAPGAGVVPGTRPATRNPELDLKQQECENTPKRKICLTAQEKHELSRLNSFSPSFNFPDPWEVGAEESHFSKEPEGYFIDLQGALSQWLR